MKGMNAIAPLDFPCPSCHQTLTAPPELFGQSIACPSCSSDLVVPSEFAPAEAVQDQPTLWNPNAAALWSLLFTPAFGSVLLHLNAKALGREKEANSLGLWILISAVVHIGAIVAVQFTGENLFRFAGIGLLILWYFAAARRQETFVKQTYGDAYPRKPWGVPIVGGVVGILALGLFVGNISGFGGGGPSEAETQEPSLIGSLLAGDSTPDISSVYDASEEEAVEAARRYMEDIWTFTAIDNHGNSQWFKFEIKQGGELLFYSAAAVDDDWGTAEHFTWDIKTGKFSDSGRRYYEVKIGGEAHWLVSAMRILIERDGRVSLRVDTDEPRELKRGDSFPFSK